jgi:hypothetical protein
MASRSAGRWRAAVGTFLEDARDLAGGRCTPADLESRRSTHSQALVSTAVVGAVNRGVACEGSCAAIDTL